jgi:8-oxo-dGTP pyrophosphatase MutT (NUDIX family)
MDPFTAARAYREFSGIARTQENGKNVMAMESPYIQQAAAIPLRGGRVCLVTSRSGKRWVVPKGCMEPDKTAAQIAVQEAWEEAGLTGVLENEPVGSYVYQKAGNIYQVTVFAMQVTRVARDWPEAGMRQRIWIDEDKAHKQVEPEGLQEVLRDFLSSLTVA